MISFFFFPQENKGPGETGTMRGGERGGFATLIVILGLYLAIVGYTLTRRMRREVFNLGQIGSKGQDACVLCSLTSHYN